MGAIVTITLPDGSEISGTTNENGWFTTEINTHGNVKIKIEKFGFKPIEGEFSVILGKLEIEAADAEVKAGEEVKFTVTVDGVPVKGAEVEITLPDGSTEKKITDGNGQVSTTSMKTGKVTAKVSKEGYKSDSADSTIKAIGKLEITVPGEFKEGDEIKIGIKDEKGNPIPDAIVSINGVEYRTDKNGEVTIIADKSMTIKAEKEGYESAEKKAEATAELPPEPPVEPPDKKKSLWWLWVIVLIIIIVLIILYFVMKRKKSEKPPGETRSLSDMQ